MLKKDAPMASPNKQITRTNHAENKSYSYAYGNVSLKFTLRTDIKSEQKDFLKLLKEAIADIELELAKKKS